MVITDGEKKVHGRAMEESEDENKGKCMGYLLQ
jgi:hypothetical protein